MATQAQILANRQNAKLSTGPKTDAGKAVSALNNLRHGFRSQSILLPGDDPAEYQALLSELTLYFQRTGDLSEQRCVREMTNAEWRLRRVRQWIECALTRKIHEIAPEHPQTGPIDLQSLAFEALHTRGSAFIQYLRYESKFERQYDRAYRDLERYATLSSDMLTLSAAAGAHNLSEMAFVKPAPEPAPPPAEPAPGPAIALPPEPAPAPVTAPVAATSTLAPAEAAVPIQDGTVEAKPARKATARNAPCPCRSGKKFKRCCGKQALPALRAA